MSAHIVYGGWEGHTPRETAELLASLLEEAGVKATLHNSLDLFASIPEDATLLVPVWTMGELTPEQAQGVCAAVERGVGLAGCHGGMCDAFRGCTDWHFLTGGQFVAHPGGEVRYRVCVEDLEHPITQGVEDFEVLSEQYYHHIDPANHILATTEFPVADGPHAANGKVKMPTIWTKRWGLGRVFYCAIGHTADDIAAEPVRTIVQRGMLWAGNLLP